MREFGGYLPFELNCGKDYFNNQEDGIVRLNCGRCTFWYSLQDIKPQKVYVPYLNCSNSTDPMDDLKIPYEYYFLDKDLTPMNINPKKDEAVLWVNYYGNATDEAIEKVKKYIQDSNLIIDNCHAFFSEPLTGAYNCYSMRKFFGVNDGAYLLKDNIAKIELPESTSSEYIAFILKCIELGTNACYEENLVNENRLCNQYKKMSVLTNKILQTIDYKKIKEKRNKNLFALHSILGKYNEFDVNMKSVTHMYYPLLIRDDTLRDKLIHNKIYTPTWWRHVPDYFSSENLESILSKYMIMLPIDQRYEESDMIELGYKVKDILLEV